MGTTVSHMNSKLSFDFDNYIRERQELANDLRSISQDATSQRHFKGTFQVASGATGVAAGVASTVALVAAPATFGLSVPIVATTAMVVGQSITAAGLAASVGTYGICHVTDKDIAKRLVNLRHLIDCLAKKDNEINEVIMKPYEKSAQTQTKEETESESQTESESEEIAKEDQKSGNEEKREEEEWVEVKKIEAPIKACQSLCEVWEEWDLAKKENKQVGFDFPFALIRSQGLFLGTYSIYQGSKQVSQEQTLETALMQTADNIDRESALIAKYKKYLQHVPFFSLGRKSISPRGRFTFIDEGGGRIMHVTFDHCGTTETLKSDSTNVVRLPEGATNVKVVFRGVRYGDPIRRVDRTKRNHPWVRSDNGKFLVDEFHFASGDGVDAVFLLEGRLNFGHIHKAWDFGRDPSVKPQSWEWWENPMEECKDLVPGVVARSLVRSSKDLLETTDKNPGVARNVENEETLVASQ